MLKACKISASGPKPAWRNGRMVKTILGELTDEIDLEVLWYLAAPVSPAEGETLTWNLGAAADYLQHLVRAGLCVVAPWIEYCTALNEHDLSDRTRGMELDLQVLARCDGIITCGPRISDGMREELYLAHRLGLRHINLVREDPADFPGHPRIEACGQAAAP